jgi:hypothetical protein
VVKHPGITLLSNRSVLQSSSLGFDLFHLCLRPDADDPSSAWVEPDTNASQLGGLIGSGGSVTTRSDASAGTAHLTQVGVGHTYNCGLCKPPP